jgi:hypothetical protein
MSRLPRRVNDVNDSEKMPSRFKRFSQPRGHHGSSQKWGKNVIYVINSPKKCHCGCSSMGSHYHELSDAIWSGRMRTSLWLPLVARWWRNICSSQVGYGNGSVQDGKLSEKGLLKQHRCCCRYLSNPLIFKTRGKSFKKITQNPAIQFAGPVWIVVCSLGALWWYHRHPNAFDLRSALYANAESRTNSQMKRYAWSWKARSSST